MSRGRPSRRAPAATLLVLRALGLGDFLTAVPAYRALARAFPEHRRILAVPAPLHALLPLLDGAFEAALVARPLGPLPPLTAPPAVAVNLHGSGPESHRVLLATAPGRFIAFAHSAVPESTRGPAWNPNEHEVARWCRLLAAAGVTADPRELELAPPAAAVPAGPQGATLIHPGAASPARRWPPERWAAVARACVRRGERVLLTGSATERPLATAIAALAALPDASVIAGATTLLELAALVARARRVLSGDTGIAHLASAYGTPSIVLFGPTPPSIWGPPPRSRHRVLWAGRAGDPGAAWPDSGLLEITPARVIEELDALGAEEARIERAGRWERLSRT